MGGGLASLIIVSRITTYRKNVMTLKNLVWPVLISLTTASSAFAGSDINLNIVGEVVTNSCEVSAGGEGATGTIAIGNWKPADFAAGAIGATALKVVTDEKAFVLSLSGCSGSAGNVSIKMLSTSVLESTTEGDILNRAGGSNAGAIVYKVGDTVALKSGESITIATTGADGATSGSLPLATRMAVEQSKTPTTGSVNAAVQFVLEAI